MDNGHVPLSAVDFLGLIRHRKVARLDLAELGYEGVLYIRDLSAAEQAKISSAGGKAGKARFYKDRSYEMELAALVEASGPRFLIAAAVTDTEEGRLLERAFEAAGPDAEWVRMSETDLVQMADVWIREAGNRAKMEQMLEGTPNVIMNAVVKRVQSLSGITQETDRVEEKKDNS